MNEGTVEQLPQRRSELADRRVELAYRLGGPHHTEVLEELARIQLAIDALDAVIAEGRSAPFSIDPEIRNI